ncbi:putative nucleic acid-binding protein [Cryobacterium mesophilum]|uniref:Ribonuclease VapC n=1 Tax=Terrimesophilobacter mesophilus TaxID=433647 RepID=A0A4R8VAB8_9MICO|nr:type II toxin-antitoxin system VapC family toxin [Terrimesophilobacter mesophilus]MBB5632677.1 putative nucleic acid-binding protein [Terrimesophilobacter mesophilus]TFB79485.1 type II toxin-antitoxin system VapC family toxin [Terrimesophilobacter mesophilus]
MTPERGLLDTSVMIAVETGRSVDYGAVPLQQFVCAISLGELYFGVHSAPTAETRAARIGTLESIASLTALPVNAAAAAHWGRLRLRLKEEGRRINVNDLWIAAVALAHGMPVITQDEDFTILSDLGGPDVIMV